MTIWYAIKELNEAQASLDASLGSQGYVQPWSYCGDGDIRHGGTATRVDRLAGFATIVESTDLASAIGQPDCAMIERGTVLLCGGIITRRRIRSALDGMGWKPSDLLQFDRAQRANEIARAVWMYGARDIDSETVVCHGEEPTDDDMPEGNPMMSVDSVVDGEHGLKTAFMEELN